MIVKLLTEDNLEFLRLKRGCPVSSEYTHDCQNATLLEISCTGSNDVTGMRMPQLIKKYHTVQEI